MFALTLAGVGRGLAAASSSLDAIPSIPSVAVHICHTGDGNTPGPIDPARYDCCDLCALGAPVVFSGAPDLPVVSPASHDIGRSAVVAWTVRLSRARSPRQSQGPPGRVT